MVGRELSELFPPKAPAGVDRPVILKAQNISVKGRVSNAAIELKAGEITALAGTVGAGEPNSLWRFSAVSQPRQGKRRDDLARRQLWQVLLLLLISSINDDALRANAIVGAYQRAKRRRSLPENKSSRHLFAHCQAKPAELFGNGHAKETHVSNFGDQFQWDRVVFGGALLIRDQTLSYKAVERGEELLQRFTVKAHTTLFPLHTIRQTLSSPNRQKHYAR